jgi:hypothetical protein
LGATSTFRGKATAPTAGAPIAQKLITPAGFYRVRVLCKFIGGTPADPADTDNFELFIDNTSVGQCSAGLALNTDYVTEFACNVTQEIKVLAHGAGTASVIYDCVVVYTKDG